MTALLTMAVIIAKQINKAGNNPDEQQEGNDRKLEGRHLC
jgi:hypothetical protein